jgi:hypothetical protein
MTSFLATWDLYDDLGVLVWGVSLYHAIVDALDLMPESSGKIGLVGWLAGMHGGEGR